MSARDSLFSSAEEAHEVMHKLSVYFGERVCRVSDHCEALETWARTMIDSGYSDLGGAYGQVQMLLMKSNLAARLVYGGERLRTVECPIHKGRWSGCVWGAGTCTEGCMYGSNVTGWLQEPHEFVDRPEMTEAERSFYAKDVAEFDPDNRCWKCGGERDKPLHKVEATA